MYPSQSWETVIGGSDVLFTKLGNGDRRVGCALHKAVKREIPR